MADLQVSCIKKTEHSREGITHLGGPASTGWCWSVEVVLAAIDAETHTFFTFVNGKRAEIHPTDGPNRSERQALPSNGCRR
jgi:hypothetical protein